MKILIVRNDKLGDFVLSLPCYALLKIAQPDVHITVMVPDYTAEIAHSCPHIDDVKIDTGGTSFQDLNTLIKQLRSHQFDVIISLYSTTRVGIAAYLAGIKYRLAPASKLAQIFYNHRLTQRRSRSEKPEYSYNMDLVTKYLHDSGVKNIPEVSPPYLTFETSLTNQLREQFCLKFKIRPEKLFIFVHAGSGGSANNLSLEQYGQLIHALNNLQPDCVFVLTAGPGEQARATELSNQLDKIEHIIYLSTEGLIAFTQHIAFANLFISGSTGTLHLAGALDVCTAAFYTRRRSATALRWQTLNSPERRIAFYPAENAAQEDMSSIDVSASASLIWEKFLKA